MKDKLLKIKKEILDNLNKSVDLGELFQIEKKYIGRKGELTGMLKDIVNLEEEQKKEFGQLANQIKKEINSKVDEIRNIFEDRKTKVSFVDTTMPGEKLERGHLSPITLVQNELEDLFKSMGFMILDGPELESDFFNFTALNIPPHHPARDMQDTFYIDKKNKEGECDLVMRTQTSPVQIRAIKKYGAPLRAIVPGRCFRSEATDVRHEHTFYQMEGIMIDKNINFKNLKGVLLEVGKRLYGANTELRMRPKFYPFVEPGSNGEYTCFICSGEGCRLCKNTGWLEVLGCGMVHPNVLKAGGIDPKEYTGFAFGFGLDRLVMLKYGINDIRLFHSGDLRFLNQF